MEVVMHTGQYLLAMTAYCVGAYFFLRKFSNHVWSYLIVGVLYIPYFSVIALWLCIPKGFHILVLLCFGLFVFGSILLILSAIVCWNKFKIFRVFFLTFSVILTAVSLEAFVIEPHWLSVRHETMTSSKLKKPLKVAVIADIQTDDVGDYEREALTKVKQYQPDIVLFAGDYIQLYDENRDHQLALLNKVFKEVNLQPPLGTFAVRGDVDQVPNWNACFKGLPIQSFEESATIKSGDLTITVLNLEASRSGTYEIPEIEGFHIVVGHAPDYALLRPKADLLVAGHTHGGQVQIPIYGPPMMFSQVPREWGRGCMTDIGNGAMLCVSRGVGLERQLAPRIRFICRPELVFIDVLPTQFSQPAQ